MLHERKNEITEKRCDEGYFFRDKKKEIGQDTSFKEPS